MGTKNEDEFDGLTESERAILAELDDDEDDLGTLREVAEDDADDEGDDGDDEPKGKKDAKKGAAADDDGDDDEAGDDAEDEGQPANTPAKRPTAAAPDPIYKAEAPGDAAAQLKDLAAERKAIRKQYEDGELDEDAYEAKLDELDQKRDAINRSVMKAEISAEMTQQQLVKSYRETVDGWLADIKRSGFDYGAPENKDAAAYLNARVIALAKADPDAPQNPEGWRSLLEEAHLLAARKFGIKAKDAQPAKESAGKPPKKGERAPDLSGIPPTIGRGPAAAAASGAGDEFGHLESLSGIALEKAIAKLSPEQLDRYLG